MYLTDCESWNGKKTWKCIPNKIVAQLEKNHRTETLRLKNHAPDKMQKTKQNNDKNTD